MLSTQTLKMNSYSLTLAALVFSLNSTPVFANDRDVRATTIPASACQPVNQQSAGKLSYNNGNWFISGQGEARLSCPLPINGSTVSDTSNDNDMTRYRVYYKDTDALGQNSSVRVRLRSIGTNGQFVSHGPNWNSNDFNNVNYTTRTQAVNVDLSPNRLYSFRVVLRKTSGVVSPRFGGIDFPQLFFPIGPGVITN